MARNAKGHFVARTRRSSRRRHRNPSGYVKIGRSWKKITKYAKRRRRGSRKGQIRAFKFPKRYRRSRRRVHANPVVVSNPGRRSRRRRSHARRNPYRRHRRYVRRNPAAAYRLSSDPIAAIKNAVMSAFSMDTIETLTQMGVGFGGSLVFGKWLYQQPWIPATAGSASLVKVGSTFVSSVVLTGLSALMKKPAMSARILTGGLFATLWQALSEAISGTQYAAMVPTLSGSPETDAFRRAIESEVLKELKSGVHGYLPAAGAEGFSTYLRPAGIEYLRPAGSEAYLTQVNSERANAGMGAFLTERESVSVDARPSGVGDDAGEFGGNGLPERF
jgi:hypothetical protein